MKTKMIPVALIAILLLGIATAYAAPAINASARGQAAITANNGAYADQEKLKESVPATYDETEKLVQQDINTTSLNSRHKFLMWTHDGNHIMWGKFGGGYFVGTDNLGKKAWGIYGNGNFAGFYDGEDFFVGKYRVQAWKAENLFDEKVTRGKFVTFP